MSAANELAIFSSYLDDQINGRLLTMSEVELRAELLLLHRNIKVAEEVGEVVDKLIGLTGANPRKGVYASEADVVEELLDGAISLLGAAESLLGNEGTALEALDRKIGRVFERAGLGTKSPSPGRKS